MATSKISFSSQAYGIGVAANALEVLADLDNVGNTGVYPTSAETLNLPSTVGGANAVGLVLVLRRGTAYVAEILVSFTLAKMYRRYHNDATWTAWTEI